MNSTHPSVGVVIPTFNAAECLPHLIPQIRASALRPDILIIDSTSEDQTISVARALGCRIKTIPKIQFNHGETRELGRKLLGTDIVVMMTQDVVPVDTAFLSRLIEPLARGEAAVSYARQIPRPGADTLEALPRHFNYPVTGHIRALEDIASFGAYTFFCSNSCAAWLNEALDQIGGFSRVVTAEDVVALAKLLQAGYKVAYVAEAVVQHSHTHSPLREFRRYFDTGYMRRDLEQRFRMVCTQARGTQYASALLDAVWHQDKGLLPRAFLQLACRYCGYSLGRFGGRIPLSICRCLTADPCYWIPHAKPGGHIEASS